jgi:hypothetical protein
MSMNPDPRTFEALRRLLVLKRYEQPPPGYFDRFPSEIIARIREYESDASIGIFEQGVPWLRRLRHALEARAVLPAAFGAAVCSVLVLGLVRSPGVPASAVTFSERLDGTFYAADSRPIRMPVAGRTAFESSTSGVLPDQPSAGIFRDMHRPRNPVFR